MNFTGSNELKTEAPDTIMPRIKASHEASAGATQPYLMHGGVSTTKSVLSSGEIALVYGYRPHYPIQLLNLSGPVVYRSYFVGEVPPVLIQSSIQAEAVIRLV